MDVLLLRGNYEQGRMAVAAGSRLRPHVLAKIDCVYQGVVDREAHPRKLTQPRLLTRLHTCIHTYIHTYTHTYLHTYIGSNFGMYAESDLTKDWHIVMAALSSMAEMRADKRIVLRAVSN